MVSKDFMHMYIVSQSIISENKIPWAYHLFEKDARLSKNLYNAALYRIRQIFTGYDKTDRTENEREVFSYVEKLEAAYPSIRVSKVISYGHLEKLMRIEQNPDFFSGLPMQTAQHVLKQATGDFKSWLKALKDYRKSPSKYLGKPKMPGYRKSDLSTFTITNQDAHLYPMDGDSDYGMLLKLPGTRNRIRLSHIAKDARLKEVKVKPYYGRFLLSLTLETANILPQKEMPNLAAVDFGVDNIAAIVSNDGSSRLYKGGAILSENRLFAKERAKAVSILTKGHSAKTASSRHLDNISYHHCNFNKDQMHKISRSIVEYCLSHGVGTLILGENKLWKQRSSIGCVNNQKFVSVPIFLLKSLIEYKAAACGITVIRCEESYTSKADFLSCDHIPTYGIDDETACFSGKRVKRGLYLSGTGEVINADLNGAANILRKAVPSAWAGITDYAFLRKPEVLGFHELNPQGIPVKRIEAA